MNNNGVNILWLISNSGYTQKVYFREEPYYLWIVKIPGNMKYNLSLTDEQPLRARYILSAKELEEVYSEEIWLQISRDNKINKILDAS